MRHIRRAAKDLRYRSLPDLVGKKITIPSYSLLVPTFEQLLESLAPERSCLTEDLLIAGLLAKYGFLDLSFRVRSELLPNKKAGIATLKELGFFDDKDAWEDLNGGDDDFFVVEDLADDIGEEAIIMLFVEDQEKPMRRDTEAIMADVRDPSRMSFPKCMTVTDACVSNSSSVWACKHFYL